MDSFHNNLKHVGLLERLLAKVPAGLWNVPNRCFWLNFSRLLLHKKISVTTNQKKKKSKNLKKKD